MARVQDPGCGMSIESQDAAGTSDCRGTRYYFCSQRCKAAFDENPAQYAGTTGSGLGGTGT